MQCNNCGWKNPDGATVCEKCSEPLAPADVQVEQDPTESPVSEEAPSVTAEVVNCPKCGYPVKSEDVYCPNCGTVVNRQSAATSDMSNRETRIFAPESVGTEPIDEGADKPGEKPKFGATTVRDGFDENASIAKTDKKDLKSTVREIPPDKLIEQEETSVEEHVQSKPVEVKHPEGFKLVPSDFICGSETLEFKGDRVPLKRSNVAPGDMALSDEPAHAEIAFEGGDWYIRDTSGRGATFVVAKRKIKIEPGDEIIIGNKKFIFAE